MIPTKYLDYINVFLNFVAKLPKPTGGLILFIHKKNNSFQLYINQQNFMTIINQYLLFLINKLLF